MIPKSSSPLSALWTFPSILVSAFVIAWGAEAAQFLISQGLALAILAWLQTLPAYRLDCGAAPQQAARLLEALVLQRAGAISPTTWAWTADAPRACS